jgi:AcrR family transcriptional regulator
MAKLGQKRKAAWEAMMKNSIFEATLNVLKKYGMEGLRMDRVARAAEVATGTVYNYFKDKEELVLYVIDNIFEPYFEILEDVRKKDNMPAEKLKNFIRTALEGFYDHWDVINVLINSQAVAFGDRGGKLGTSEIRPKITGLLTGIIEEGIKDDIFRFCNAFRASSMIFGAIEGLLSIKITGEDHTETFKEEEVEECLALLLPGLLKTR